MSIEKIIEAINKNKRFLITSHVNLEGDAIGSQLALAELLKYLGKRVVVVDEDKPSREYMFLPNIKDIKTVKTKFNFDAAIVVDCSDFKRAGGVYKLIDKNKLTINIDHHVSNSRFCDINWVDRTSASCSGMIYELYKKLNVPINKKVAMLLYVGLATDTGFFRYSNTNACAHKIAFEFLSYNLPVAKIYQNIYESTPFSDTMLLIEILKTLKKDRKGKIVWLVWGKHLNDKKRKTVNLSDALLTFLRSIKGIEVAILFKELEGRVRVNLRSQGCFDVNKLARFFGGGGHKTASGCTIKASLNEAEALVIKQTKSLMKK